MFKKMGAAVVSATLLIAITVASADSASAVSGRQFNLQHGTSGLRGNLGYKTINEVPMSLAFGAKTGFLPFDSSGVPASVQAGSGYCVWEQVYAGEYSALKKPVASVNRGKSQSRRYYPLVGYQMVSNSTSYTSYVQIYKC